MNLFQARPIWAVTDKLERESRGYYWFQGQSGLTRMNELWGSGQLLNARSVTVFKVPQADLSFIGELHNLIDLEIHGTSLGQVEIAKLKKLKSVELRGGIVARITGFEKLRPFSSLVIQTSSSEALARIGGHTKFLHLHSCPEIMPELHEVEYVKKLKIYRSGRGPIDIGAIRHLKNLRWLSINSLSKGLVNCDSFRELTKLKSLLLWDVASLDTKNWLFDMPKLRDLGVWGANDFSEEEFAKLDSKIGLSRDEPKSVVKSFLE
jgi:hypothetical protein